MNEMNSSMPFKALLLLKFGWLLVGCSATISSAPLSLKPVSEAMPEGLVYFLPKRTLTVSATQTPVTDDAIKKLQAQRDAAKKAKDKADNSAKEAKKELDRAQGALARSPSAAVKKNRDAKEQAFQVADALAKQRKTELEALEKRLVDAQKSKAAKVPKYSISVTANPLEPDESQAWVADLGHNVFRDDNETITVGSNGLLGSAKVEATGRLGEVIVELARLAGSILGPSPSAVVYEAATPNKGTCPFSASGPLAFKVVFDPAKELDTVNRALTKCFPYKLEVMKPVEKAKVTATSARPVDGLVYRPMLPYVVKVHQCPAKIAADGKFEKCTDFELMQTAAVLVPQGSPVSYIPFSSGFLGSSVNDVTFENGVVTRWHKEDSSEVLDVVRLPFQAIGALFEGPAKILSLKVDYTNSEAGLLEAQRAQKEAQLKLNLLNECLDKYPEEAEEKCVPLLSENE